MCLWRTAITSIMVECYGIYPLALRYKQFSIIHYSLQHKQCCHGNVMMSLTSRASYNNSPAIGLQWLAVAYRQHPYQYYSNHQLVGVVSAMVVYPAVL